MFFQILVNTAFANFLPRILHFTLPTINFNWPHFHDRYRYLPIYYEKENEEKSELRSQSKSGEDRWLFQITKNHTENVYTETSETIVRITLIKIPSKSTCCDTSPPLNIQCQIISCPKFFCF